jgi:hypothetical protein
MGSLAQCHSRLSLDIKITAVFGPAFATLAVAGVPAVDHRNAATFPSRSGNRPPAGSSVMKSPREILLPFFHATNRLTLRGITGPRIRRREAVTSRPTFALGVTDKTGFFGGSFARNFRSETPLVRTK